MFSFQGPEHRNDHSSEVQESGIISTRATEEIPLTAMKLLLSQDHQGSAPATPSTLAKRGSEGLIHVYGPESSSWEGTTQRGLQLLTHVPYRCLLLPKSPSLDASPFAGLPISAFGLWSERLWEMFGP